MKEYWDTKLDTAFVKLTEARKGFFDWLSAQFYGLTPVRPFAHANCSTGAYGVITDTEGCDLFVRFIWRGVPIEIMWGWCPSSSYFLATFYDDASFSSYVDNVESDNPDTFVRIVKEYVEQHKAF